MQPILIAPPSRRAVLAGLGSLGLTACTTRPVATVSAPRFVTPPLAPVRLDPDRITRITVCLRPFRAAGPRLDVETVGSKRVVHNYGHGGSGWSLSWGSSAIAARRALEGGAREVAVIGCGALGLTSALLLQRAGAKVTIYARDRPADTRSARATGVWSPDSRVADVAAIAPDFAETWDAMARASFATHQQYLGMPGEPVSFSDRYIVAGGTPAAVRLPEGVPAVRFAHFPDRLLDIAPPPRDLPPGSTPFGSRRVRRMTSMQFNVAELMHLLTTDFLIEGGRIVPMTFASPADLTRLPEPVVVNCTGYGARALWNDTTMTPVRGQIAWLAPQPEVRYGIQHAHVSVLPRPDGIVVQQTGASDMWGYGDESETPDRAEAEAAIASVAGLFDGRG